MGAPTAAERLFAIGKLNLRQDVRQAGLGNGLANAWRADIYRRSGNAHPCAAQRRELAAYLRHVTARIGAHPVNRLHDLLPWNIASPPTHSVAV